jgi:IclR family KDG regulon transcriptional repressor
MLKTESIPGTAAFAKGIAVLQLVADSHNLSKHELQQRCGLPRQTLHRLLKALEAEQLVECSHDNRYHLGARMFQFAGRAIEQNEILHGAEPELRRLSELTRETTHLAVRSGEQMVYLLKQDSPQAVRLATHVGGRVALHASSIGKSLLAFLPEDERDQIIDDLELPRITEYTVSSKKRLCEQLREIVQRGYAVATQESELDVQCYGAAILDHRRMPVAGVSISVPMFRLASDPESHYIEPLLETCHRISERIGGEVRQPA